LAVTEINLKTLPNHELNVNVAQSGSSFNLIESLKTKADEKGYAKVVTDTTVAKVNVFVQVNYGGVKIMVQRFDDVSTGGKLHLQVEPGEISNDYKKEEWYLAAIAAELNESVQLDSEINEEGEEEGIEEEELVDEVIIDESEIDSDGSSGITGYSIIDNFKGVVGIFYVIIALVVVLVAVLVIRGVVSKKVSGVSSGKIIIGGGPSKISGPNKLRGPISEDIEVEERELRDAEEKIKEAKADLARLKNKEKIKTAELKLIEDQKRLRDLREGKEVPD
jgi:hypothetical protein